MKLSTYCEWCRGRGSVPHERRRVGRGNQEVHPGLGARNRDVETAAGFEVVTEQAACQVGESDLVELKSLCSVDGHKSLRGRPERRGPRVSCGEQQRLRILIRRRSDTRKNAELVAAKRLPTVDAVLFVEHTAKAVKPSSRCWRRIEGFEQRGEHGDLLLLTDVDPRGRGAGSDLLTVGLGHPLAPVSHRPHKQGGQSLGVSFRFHHGVEHCARGLVVRAFVVATAVRHLDAQAHGVIVVQREAHDSTASQAAQAGDALWGIAFRLKDGERVEAPGRWVQGAAAVGADPEVRIHGAVLRELVAVRHPVTGEPLRAAGASGVRVAALDATFSAPKSVSAVWAVADPALRAQIEQAHETAVDRALAYAAQQVPLARQRVDRETVTHIRVAELVATSWRHTTARAVDGNPPDPQLHSHVLLHAAVRRDGKMVAIDSRQLFTHRRELGAAYRTELALELSKLGYRVERGTGQGGRYFEIAQVPQLLLDIWSARHRQVQEAIRQRLIRTGQKTLTPAEERMIGVSTRAAKQPTTNADLDRHWHATAGRYRFGPAERAELRAKVSAPSVPVDSQAVSGALTEFDATFTRSQARAVALEQNAGLPIRQALDTLGRLRTHGELLTLTDGRLTTRRHRHAELATIHSLQAVAAERLVVLPRDLVQAEATALDERLRRRGGRLSDEQRQALELATSDRQLVVIEGQAGSGKSTVLQAVARVHQEWGQHVIVTSTSALAAERLGAELEDAGVNTLTFSTAALNAAIYTGRIELNSLSTIIHDEAAVASTRELQPLLACVEESGARLILVGDPHQNQPVGAGGLWPYIEQGARGSSAHAALTGNVRAQDPDDRLDQALFRTCEHQQALHGYAARGRVHIHDDQATAEDAALEAAHTDCESGRRTLVIAQTSNHHLDELNARVQAIRLQNDELGNDALAVPGRPYALHAGDEIQIRQTIESPDGGWLRNGTGGIVTAVNTRADEVTLRLADQREITLSQDQLGLADVRLAYVQHPFPAQGITTDTIHVIVGEHATAPGSYVGLTRSRRRTDVYASRELLEINAERDPIESLAKQMGRDEPAVASIDVPAAQLTRQATRDGLGKTWDTHLTQARPVEADLEREAAAPGIGWEL